MDCQVGHRGGADGRVVFTRPLFCACCCCYCQSLCMAAITLLLLRLLVFAHAASFLNGPQPQDQQCPVCPACLHTHTYLAWRLLSAMLALVVAIHCSHSLLWHRLPRQQQQHLAVCCVGVLLAGPEP